MATKEDIITLPNNHLRQKSARVGLITPEIKQIISDMQDATIDWEANRKHEVGVALAAVQIDKLYRIVIIRNDIDNRDNKDFQLLINPEITKTEGDLIEDHEGCLSVKDVYGVVPRYEKVKVKAIDINGKPFRITAKGFLARALQHEIDHNNGKLFIDIIKDEPDKFFRLQPDGKLAPLDFETEIKNNKDLWS
jgi:peptide deformylase